jgi:hypothetical protein
MQVPENPQVAGTLTVGIGWATNSSSSSFSSILTQTELELAA